jgi:hypothetical protein
MRKNFTSITCRAAFSDVVDWSAILIDLWEAPGSLMSEKWVKSGPDGPEMRLPLYTQNRTSLASRI